MSIYVTIIVCWIILLDGYLINAHYSNDTAHMARMISEDFRLFQKTGKRVSGRDARRLISFDSRNDNIEVGLEFSVPFISIPVKRSIDTMKAWATTNTTTYVTNPIVNINSAAIALTGAVVLGGVTTAYIWKTFIKDQLAFSKRRPASFSGGRRYSTLNELDDNGDDPVTKFTDQIERLLQKYDVDATTCTQRTLCMTVRSASENVAKGSGTSTEKIFDGITSTSWMKRLTAGTAINDAISAGQHWSDCEQKYSGCKLKFKSFEHIFESLLSSLS